MDFELNEDQQLLRETVRRLAVERIAGHGRRADSERRLAQEQLAELAELGLTGILIGGEEGAGLGAVELVVVVEELARADAGLAWTVAVHNLAARLLELSGARGERWRQPAARGESWLTWALAEAGGEAACTLTAERHAELWVLDGRKLWVPCGHQPSCAVVVARTGEQRTLFAVPLPCTGLVVQPVDNVLGLRSADPSNWSFGDTRLTDEHRLGELGSADAWLTEVRPLWQVTLAAIGVGLGRAAVAAAGSYARERKQFGQAIGEFQAVQWKLADAAMRVEAAAVLTSRAALTCSSAPKSAAVAKLKAAEAALFAADVAVQVHGGYGYTVEFVPERLYRDAQTLVAALAPHHGLRRRIAEQVLADSR